MAPLPVLRLGNGVRPSDPRFEEASPGSDTAVPVLDVDDQAHELIGAEHESAIEALQDGDASQLLTHAFLLFDNPSPKDGSAPGSATFGVGGSTLHEAATEAVQAVHQLANDCPTWVASSDGALAEVLAKHFTILLPATDDKGKPIMATYNRCEAIPLSEANERMHGGRS